MENQWEEIIGLFRRQLLDAFSDWLEKNREAIGKWYESLQKQTWRECATPIEIMGTAMWMFNSVADLGVLAGIGPNQVNIVEIREGLDKQSTVRLLHLIKACMNLQYLPREIGNKSIPITSAKQFSLKLFTQQTQQ